MDNKEVIKVIKSNYPTVNYSMLREALNIAIKLLEKEDGHLEKVVESLNNKVAEQKIEIAKLKKELRDDFPCDSCENDMIIYGCAENLTVAQCRKRKKGGK